MSSRTLNYIVATGEASSTPPLGPKVGQYGLNIIKFCDDFNLLSSFVEVGTPVYVEALVNSKNEASLVIKNVVLSYLISKTPLDAFFFISFIQDFYKNKKYYRLTKSRKRLFYVLFFKIFLIFTRFSYQNTLVAHVAQLRQLVGSLCSFNIQDFLWLEEFTETEILFESDLIEAVEEDVASALGLLESAVANEPAGLEPAGAVLEPFCIAGFVHPTEETIFFLRLHTSGVFCVSF